MSNNADNKKNDLNSVIVNKNNKTYLNLCVCHLNVGLVFVYIYILASFFIKYNY